MGEGLWDGCSNPTSPSHDYKSKQMTLGEQRVRVEFNPDALDTVSQIKSKTAELINLTQNLSPVPRELDGDKGELLRLISLALTSYEEAAMWAVKAATYK